MSEGLVFDGSTMPVIITDLVGTLGANAVVVGMLIVGVLILVWAVGRR